MLDEQHAAPALAGHRGAHHAGRTGTDDDDVERVRPRGRNPA
jgi:hypothetical protein